MKFKKKINDMSLKDDFGDLSDLNNLTEEERDTILSVISRDEILREADHKRVRY